MSSNIKFMGAEAARDIVKRSKEIDEIRNNINRMICQAARKGKYEVQITARRDGSEGVAIFNEIVEELKKLGYHCDVEIINCTYGYININWKENYKKPPLNPHEPNSNVKLYFKPNELRDIYFKVNQTSPLTRYINGKLCWNASCTDNDQKAYIYIDEVDRTRFNEEEVNQAIEALTKLGFKYNPGKTNDVYSFFFRMVI